MSSALIHRGKKNKPAHSVPYIYKYHIPGSRQQNFRHHNLGSQTPLLFPCASLCISSLICFLLSALLSFFCVLALVLPSFLPPLSLRLSPSRGCSTSPPSSDAAAASLNPALSLPPFSSSPPPVPSPDTVGLTSITTCSSLSGLGGRCASGPGSTSTTMTVPSESSVVVVLNLSGRKICGFARAEGLIASRISRRVRCWIA